jgi:hypothetical protein
MNVLTAQDQQFVDAVRTLSTALLQVNDAAQALGAEWDKCFGNVARIPSTIFAVGTPYEGLTKDQVSAGVIALRGLQTWLSTGGTTTWLDLQNLRAVSQKNQLL